MLKRIAAIIVLLMAFGLNAEAAWDYGFGYKPRSSRKNVPVIGVKGGFTFYEMRFSDNYYDGLKLDKLNSPGFGMFAEFPFEDFPKMSIGVDILMIERGMSKSFNFRETISEIDRIDAKYIDLRIPVTYYFLDTYAINPYVFVAADVAFCFGGQVSKEFPNGELPNVSVDISKSDAVMSPFDLSAVFGAGLRYKISFKRFTLPIKLEADYNLGLLNTLSSTNGTPIDVYAYTFEKETRKNRGFEIMLSIGIPLKFEKHFDPCSSWN